MEEFAFDPLLWPCGSENMGGYTNRLAWVSACAVTATPLIPTKAEAVTLEDLAIAKGAFEFKDAAGKPTPIYATDKTVTMNAENQGEVDGRSFNVTGSFLHPGSSVQNAAFARLINNTPGYLILETPEKNQFIVGQPGLPCNVSPAYAGGQARADRRGTTYNFQADSFVPYAKLAVPLDFDTLFADAEENGEVTPP